MNEIKELDAEQAEEVGGGKSLGIDPNGGDTNNADTDRGCAIDPNG